jgi:hypothetical protein
MMSLIGQEETARLGALIKQVHRKFVIPLVDIELFGSFHTLILSLHTNARVRPHLLRFCSQALRLYVLFVPAMPGYSNEQDGKTKLKTSDAMQMVR